MFFLWFALYRNQNFSWKQQGQLIISLIMISISNIKYFGSVFRFMNSYKSALMMKEKYGYWEIHNAPWHNGTLKVISLIWIQVVVSSI